MSGARGLLVRSPWALVGARRLITPATRSQPFRGKRAYSQHNPSPRQPTAEEDSRHASKGLVKDVGREKVTITLPRTDMNELDERTVDVPYIQLRDACQCPRCVDPQTKQRFFRTSEIPSDIAPREIKWLDEKQVLEISWNKDIAGHDSDVAHVTRLTADDIKYPPAHFHQTAVASGKPRLHWAKNDMEQAQHWISYHDYMENDDLLTSALHNLSLYGLLFVHDIPDSRAMVEKIAWRMGPLRNTFYGSTWDVRHDPRAKNVAYTNQNLGFHMDLLYVQNPPGFQLLHCLRNSCEGGESLFVDAFGAAAGLDKRAWETLATFQVPYHYNHTHQYFRMTRPVLEAAADADNLGYVNYSPPFQGPFHLPPGETSGAWTHRMKEYLSAIRQFEGQIHDPERIFELKLNPGECVIFENRRVLHARRAFDTAAGERWLAGAYVDEDAVHSRMFTLKRNGGLFQGSQSVT
jgi:gamma-butyrobetaine dioxygenase